MKIVFAQGNPGNEFTNTRHNAGFMAVDYCVSQHNTSFQPKPKFFADVAEILIDGEKALFVKPTTYYNETGKSARALADFYKIDNENIIVIHDELALPFGTLRTREKGSDAGNNGIKSLNAHLGEDFARIRVGINNELADRVGAHDFVLSRFSKEESERLQNDILPKICELIDQFIADNHANTSHIL